MDHRRRKNSDIGISSPFWTLSPLPSLPTLEHGLLKLKVSSRPGHLASEEVMLLRNQRCWMPCLLSIWLSPFLSEVGLSVLQEVRDIQKEGKTPPNARWQSPQAPLSRYGTLALTPGHKQGHFSPLAVLQHVSLIQPVSLPPKHGGLLARALGGA